MGIRHKTIETKRLIVTHWTSVPTYFTLSAIPFIHQLKILSIYKNNQLTNPDLKNQHSM